MDLTSFKHSAAGRIVAGLCAVCLLSGLLSGCIAPAGSDSPNEDALPVITVGSDNYPPFNYQDTSGHPTGIDVDLATEAFRRMGYRAQFATIDWEEKKNLVESGAIDCIWGGFSINGREDQYLWTQPYMYSRQVVAVRKDSGIYSLSDLAGKCIAVQSTTKPEELFLSHTDPRIPAPDDVFSLQNPELLYSYLSKGYADAIAAHETSILQCMDDYGLELRILDQPLFAVGLGVAFARSDDRGLAQELSRTFSQMRDDGTTQQILGKYLENPQKYMEASSYAND